MTGKLQDYLVRYKALKILSSKEETSITKEDISKLKDKIISNLDYELEFTKMYEILKSIEKEGFGFYAKLFRCECIARRKLEKIVWQQLEIGVKYMGGSKFNLIDDMGYTHTTKMGLPKVKSPKKISPEEIISISNIEILKNIKAVDEKVYEYIVERIIDTLYEEVEDKFEEEKLRDILSRVIVNNNLGEYLENTFFIKKENNTFTLHFFKNENGVSIHYKSIYYNICEAYDELLKMFEDTKKEGVNDLQKAFYLELINI